MPATSGGAKQIEVLPAAVTGTAESIAAEVTRAAQPGPAPTPGAGSVIDVAAAGVAAAVATNVAQASATLAPEPVKGVQKAQTAVTEFGAQDSESATDIRSVAQGVQAMPPPGGGGQPATSVQAAGYTPSAPEGPWGLDDYDGDFDIDPWGNPALPVPVAPDMGGAAAGPGASGGVVPI